MSNTERNKLPKKKKKNSPGLVARKVTLGIYLFYFPRNEKTDRAISNISASGIEVLEERRKGTGKKKEKKESELKLIPRFLGGMRIENTYSFTQVRYVVGTDNYLR